jgi:hypothetical protein
MILSKAFDKKLRKEVEQLIRATLAKYVGQKSTRKVRKQIVADLLALGEKKR